MSLVAYDSSSDEESECDKPKNDKPSAEEHTHSKDLPEATGENLVNNADISDEEDDYMLRHTEQFKTCTYSLLLPKPARTKSILHILQEIPRTPFQALPTPRRHSGTETYTEEDDEFLYKKDTFVPMETKPSTKIVGKVPVKISIPSLEEFRDVQNDVKSPKPIAARNENTQGLLGLLPQAKSERNFSKIGEYKAKNVKDTKKNNISSYALVPDTVKYGRPAQSTEEFSNTLTRKQITPKDNPKSEAFSDSEPSDAEDPNLAATGMDFFSLASEDILPEVSANEINALVAKKSAKMAEVTKKNMVETESNEQYIMNTQSNIHEFEMAPKRYHEQQLDSEAVQALVGSTAKRRRNQNEPINIMEIKSSEILPSRDEWMRTALASSTVYQATGVLVDEEPAAGTRRKHQITYLAHKAKANEAELQAMWAANRQTRRATQSKYGF